MVTESGILVQTKCTRPAQIWTGDPKNVGGEIYHSIVRNNGCNLEAMKTFKTTTVDLCCSLLYEPASCKVSVHRFSSTSFCDSMTKIPRHSLIFVMHAVEIYFIQFQIFTSYGSVTRSMKYEYSKVFSIDATSAQLCMRLTAIHSVHTPTRCTLIMQIRGWPHLYSSTERVDCIVTLKCQRKECGSEERSDSTAL